MRVSMACLLLFLLVGAARAGLAAAAPTAGHTGAASTPTLDRTDLQRFVDRYVRQSMAASHVPGAVVAVVKDGRVLIARGYGYADLARRTPVVPGRTLFRVASLSKLVVATAVMQLAEHGRLQLDADVDRYLRGVRLPATYPRPITLAHLLTHTAGFEDRTIGEATLSAAGLRPLAAYLADRRPARVLPPGAIYSYSNYGFALAGYVVEAVSGLPFARYADQHIFRPLGMRASTFDQPLPSALAPRLAQGYDVPGTTPLPAPFEYFDDAPADALSTTALDMARFMIANLQEGRDGAGRILAPATLRQMHALHYRASPDDDFDGMAYGFEHYRRNGQLILSKEGDIRGFGSYLSLLPAHHLGVFVAANTDATGWMQDLERRLVNRYYPARPAAPPITPAALRGSLAAFAGSYWSNRYSHTTIEKLGQLMRQVQITDDGGGTLSVRFPDGGAVRLTRVGPLRFENVYQGVAYHWGFLRGADGHIAHFLAGNDSVYDRIPWYETTQVQEGVIAALAVVFLAGGVAWLVLPVVRRRERWSGGGVLDRLAAAALPVAGLTCALNLAFLVALGLILQSATATRSLDYTWLMYGIPAYVYVLLCLPLLTTALTVVVWLCGVAAWRTRRWTALGYMRYAVVALAALAFILVARDWNLLGVHV